MCCGAKQVDEGAWGMRRVSLLLRRRFLCCCRYRRRRCCHSIECFMLLDVARVLLRWLFLCVVVAVVVAVVVVVTRVFYAFMLLGKLRVAVSCFDRVRVFLRVKYGGSDF